MNERQVDRAVVILVIFIAVSLVVVCITAYSKYWFFKDYFFLVEAPCDANSRVCYIRDCNEEYCPPNELAEYTVYRLKAHTFAQCTDNTCMNVCDENRSLCTEISCSEAEGYQCSSPTASL